MFLLDTEVVAALRHPDPAPTGLTAWARAQAPGQLFLSALSLAELETACRRPRDKAVVARLHAWLDDQLLPAFEGRILPLDAAVIRRRRTIALADDRDALLAATALEQGLALASRRGGAYKPARVRVVDPAAFAPADPLDWRAAARADGPHWIKTLFARG